jgi:hypothetical protein
VDNTLKIVIPTRPQPDTIVAIFLLKTLGKGHFEGIDNAIVEVQPILSGKSFEEHLRDGVLALDVGGGPLDHHGKNTCASTLVAQMLGKESDPSLSKLLAYAMRDDREGRGTVSVDPLDRAFGLSGIIASLNKQHPNNPQHVVSSILPLLEAHYRDSLEHNVELPKDVASKKALGSLKQGTKKIKLVSVVSDKPSMPTYLRSWNGGRADVVLQKSEQGNRICVITKQDRKINLSMAAALIRLREAEIRNIQILDTQEYLTQNGKISELPFWYVDPATNSILNVGNEVSDQSQIPWNEMNVIVHKGLELAPER